MADLLQDKKFSDFSEISSTQDKTIYFVGYEENGNNIKISDTNLLSGLERIEEVDDTIRLHINDNSIHKTDDDVNNIISISNQVKTINADTTNLNENEVKNSDYFIIYSTSNLYLDTLVENVQENCFVYCDVINKSDSTISIYNSSISTSKSIYNLKTNEILSAKISKIIDEENQTTLYKINVLEKEDVTMVNLLSSTTPKNEYRVGNVYYSYKNSNETLAIEYDVSNTNSSSFFRWEVGNMNFADSSFYEVSNNRIIHAIYSGGSANTKTILSNNVFDITAQQVNINGKNIIEPINSISTIESNLTSHIENIDIHKNEEQIKEIINESNKIKVIDVSTTSINETDIHNGDSFIIRTTSNLYLDTLLTNVQEDCFVYCDVINKSDSTISIYNSSLSTTEPLYNLEQNSVFSTKISKIIDESIYKVDILEKGKSAYDIWIEEGNNGTESDFLNSLKGEKGDKGENGKSAYEYANESGYEGTESDFSQSLMASSKIVSNFDHEKMMALARAVCFSKAPYPEEFMMAEEATTAAEWQSLAPQTYAINGEDQENYVEYHPNSEGGKNPWQMTPVAQRYYLVTKKTYAVNAGWMCRGVYNFIWNLDSSGGGLHMNALDLELIKFWFVYLPNETYCDTLYNCIFGRNASVIIIAPKLTAGKAGIILDTEEKIASVSTKHYIRCYLPSLNVSNVIAPYHRGIPSGLIFTLNSLPDVTGNTTKPTVTLGVDPDVVESTAEDGTMTFTDANLQTAVDNATAKGWTVAFNATPYPTSETTETSSDASITEESSTLTSYSTNNRWYHCELNEYGNYLNSEGNRVSIISAKGFFGGEDDGSWFKATSENEAANNWNLTYSPLSLQ